MRDSNSKSLLLGSSNKTVFLLVVALLFHLTVVMKGNINEKETEDVKL